jgi:hypothetical protein
MGVSILSGGSVFMKKLGQFTLKIFTRLHDYLLTPLQLGIEIIEN